MDSAITPTPIVFKKRIRIFMEHGHAHESAVRYCSTAYWCQAESHVYRARQDGDSKWQDDWVGFKEIMPAV